jgi:hypothetical protein
MMIGKLGRSGLDLWQELEAGHSGHVDVAQD